MSRAERNKAYRERHLERLRAEGRERHHANSEEINRKKRERRAENLEVVRERERVAASVAYKSMTPEARRERNRKNWQRNGERISANRRDKRYGLAPGEYDQMLQRQGNACAICRVDRCDAPSGVLVVDHCHSTGAVRALLCQKCNLDLAFVEYRGHLFSAMEEYLKSHSESAKAKVTGLQAIIRKDRGQ